MEQIRQIITSRIKAGAIRSHRGKHQSQCLIIKETLINTAFGVAAIGTL